MSKVLGTDGQMVWRLWSIVKPQPGRQWLRRSLPVAPRAFVALVAVLSLLAYSVSDVAPASAAVVPPVVLANDAPPPLPTGAHLVTAAPAEATRSLTVTVTLNRTDEAGFEAFLADVQDPGSGSYQHFMSQSQLAERFGPSQTAYDEVVSWLKSRGLRLVQGSDNRLTITVSGSRDQVDRAFHVTIQDYKLGDHSFETNDQPPTLPSEIALYVASVSGLSTLAVPTVAAPTRVWFPNISSDCETAILGSLAGIAGGLAFLLLGAAILALLPGLLPFLVLAEELEAIVGLAGLGVEATNFNETVDTAYAAGACFRQLYFGGSGGGGKAGGSAIARVSRNASQTPSTAPAQKIGLLEFDTFHASDVADWLDLVGANTQLASQLSTVAVDGGVANPGAGESEVLVDIDTVMGMDPSPNASYVVYDAPSSTSFQTMFNAMINDGDTVISNSWSQCEDETSRADALSIDSVLAQAAASGISVFNGTGDSGTTCLDGSPDTIGVPADSPNATAVGGTYRHVGPGLTVGNETYWDDSQATPTGGQGGYGVSSIFSRPSYQDGLVSSPMRLVPDVALNAEPRTGIGICQTDAGGCPNGLLYGGTSLAAPEMAGMVAGMNEQLGRNIGNANTALYPLAGTSAFRTASTMGSTFAKVGLGDPNLASLELALSHQSVGPVSPTESTAAGAGIVPADGATPAAVQVDLRDANGFPVSGKSVTIAADPAAGSTITPIGS